MNPLTDEDGIPFGKYKGTKMMHVPVDYLHYLWTNGIKNKVNVDPVAAYINENLEVLKDEDLDRIWS